MDPSSSAPERRLLLKQALDAVETLKAKVASLESGATGPIAIIGAGCRLPGKVNGLDDYWRLLQEGKDAVIRVPLSRWGEQPGYESAEWHAGLIDDVDCFDPQFFNISTREALMMDPQQRLVLEVVWEAIENAGQAPRQLDGSRTGVFIGMIGQEYSRQIGGGEALDVYAASGNAHNATPGRVSYFLGLQGPSMAIDTACSSSLVSVHLACQSLRTGECNMALAGGVNLILAPEPFFCFSNWGMLSADGRCKSFDSQANGFVRGEGCGIVVLKRLSDAFADGDNILAVIRGSAVNQDGRSSGVTVPNGLAQEAVIRQALANASVRPDEISYVETHGTGTSLGDPIEAHALTAVLGTGRAAGNALILGAAKTNLGHLEAAAGVAGLIKTILCLKHEQIPRNLHFREMNPRIDWGGMPVSIPVKAQAWPRAQGRRLAGVSAFGFSGTNAHVILEEAPQPEERNTSPERPLHSLALSARTEASLHKLVDLYRTELGHSADPVPDICYTANARRAHFGYRLCVAGCSVQELAAGLRDAVPIRQPTKGDGLRLACLFSGQGSQYAGMGKQLWETQPIFRRVMEECAELLEDELEKRLLDVLWGSASHLLDQTAYTQPALFAVEYALAELWRSWGITPAAVLGHSVGEYVAACVAGVYSLPEGLKLIAARGRLMQELPGKGAMAAVMASEGQVLEALEGLEGSVSLAAFNAPGSLVISGYESELEIAEGRLRASGSRVQRLAVSHGFHSPQMRGMEWELEQVARSLTYRAPRVALISSVSGQSIGRGEMNDSAYWRKQITQPVRFRHAMETLRAEGYTMFLEVGPGMTLTAMGQQCLPGDESKWTWSLKKGRGEWEQILESLGRLYVRGAEVNWEGFDEPYRRRLVALPSYPFERQRYWVEPVPPCPATGHPLLGRRLEFASAPGTAIWENEIGLDSLPYLADHCVQGAPLFPATGYVEMVTAAGNELFGECPLYLGNFEFQKPLFLKPDAHFKTQVILAKDSVDSATARVFSRPASGGDWILHATGKIARAIPPSEDGKTLPFPAFTQWARREVGSQAFYSFFATRGNDWGPAFQGATRFWLRGLEAWGEIVAPSSIRAEAAHYLCHPALADACGQTLNAITVFGEHSRHREGALVGGSIDRVTLYRRARGQRLLAYAQLAQESNPNEFRGNLRVYDEDGQLISDLEGAHLCYLEAQDTETLSPESWIHRVTWKNLRVGDAAPEQRRSWMVLADRSGLGRVLADAIKAAGLSCELIISAPPEAIPLVAAAARQSTPTSVVCLWPLDIAVSDAATASGAISTVVGSNGVFQLLQKIAVAGSSNTLLWLVTRGAQDAGGSCGLNFWQAPVWGLGRTFACEHASNWGGLIDLDPDQATEAAASALWSHLRAAGGEDQVCLRQAERLVARLERSVAPASGTVRFRADGTYLITGGLSGLGLEVARWVVDQGARRLILLGRTPLPPRTSWSEIGASHPRCQAIETVCALEREGASVTTAAIDIADEPALRDFLRQWRASNLPPIRGIVSCAGVLLQASLAEMHAADFAAVLRPKIAAWVLHRVFASEPLDFCVLFSSASAVLSSPKLGGYAAANLFLDALAQHCAHQGKPVTSIQWGMWVGAGMTTHVAAGGIDRLREHGMGAIAVDQGMELLSRLIHQTGSVAVLPNDWNNWVERYPSYVSNPLVSDLLRDKLRNTGRGAARRSIRSILDLSESERMPALADHLSVTLASILGLRTSAIDTSIHIDQLGLDSLMALEFKTRIDAELGVVLPVVRLLQGPSLLALAAELLEQHASKLKDTLRKPLLDRIDELTEAELDETIAALLAESGS